MEKWSNAKIMECVEMRLRGKTLQEIADHYGCSRQNVHQVLGTIVTDPNKTSCIYAGLTEWMRVNGCTKKDMAIRIGMPVATLGYNLRGINSMKIDTVFKILKLTGLTFEEAFGEKYER